MKLIESKVELGILCTTLHQVEKVFNTVVVLDGVLRIIDKAPEAIVLESFLDAVPLGGNLDLPERHFCRPEITWHEEQSLDELAVSERNLSDIQSGENIHRVIALIIFNLVPDHFRMVKDLLEFSAADLNIVECIRGPLPLGVKLFRADNVQRLNKLGAVQTSIVSNYRLTNPLFTVVNVVIVVDKDSDRSKTLLAINHLVMVVFQLDNNWL